MKKNNQMILFALYQGEVAITEFYRSYEYLQTLFASLSSGGLRSMMKKLSDEGWVHKTTIDNRTYFSLTQLGKHQLWEYYPFLKPTKRKGIQQKYILICIAPPKSDPQFLRLRTQLAKYYAIKITRGVYLLQFTTEEELQRTLLNTYNLSVVVMEMKDFVFGELSLLETTIHSPFAVKKSLSGVSKKIASLLDFVDDQKGLNSYAKATLSSSFYSVEGIVRLSPVLDATYPEVASEVRKVLLDWTQLLSSIFSGT